MKSNYEVIPFSDLQHFEAISMGLPTATLKNVVVGGKLAEKFKAVVNDSTQEIETICSDKYLLIEHKKILEPVISAMKTLGINVNGKVIVDGGRVYCDMYFDDERFKIDVSNQKFASTQEIASKNLQKGDIINFGMRFFNSYDKTTSFGAEVVALRLVCQNGMIRPVALKSIREVHTGDKKMVIKSITKLFEALVLESPRFADMVDRARKEIVTEQMLKALLVSWKLGEKHIKNILSQAKKIDELNGWTIYNLLTSYITRELQCRESTKEKWHKKYANAVLNMPIEALIAGGKAKGA